MATRPKDLPPIQKPQPVYPRSSVSEDYGQGRLLGCLGLIAIVVLILILLANAPALF